MTSYSLSYAKIIKVPVHCILHSIFCYVCVCVCIALNVFNFSSEHDIQSVSYSLHFILLSY